MRIDATFWSGRKVLITGHTGFKGSWLSLWLQRMGAQVTGLALAPATEPALFTLARVAEGMRDQIVDVRDFDSLRAVVASTQPEVVLHLAAQALVRPSYLDPIGTFATNVMGTVHLLEAVRQCSGVRVVVNVTSDKCYDNPVGSPPHPEQHPMGGHDPYSSSKGCAELVGAAYAHAYFVPAQGVALASARAGNTLGGGDWAADRLIPDMIRAFVAGEAVQIRYPQAVRPWQHVLDPLAGYLLLAQALWHDPAQFAGGWNFGPDPGQSVDVRQLVETLVRLWGPPALWEQVLALQPYEAATLRLDPAKAARELGWSCRLDVPELLSWTVSWYRRWQAGADPQALCLEQIAAYEALF